jgi:hypothetical protein
MEPIRDSLKANLFRCILGGICLGAVASSHALSKSPQVISTPSPVSGRLLSDPSTILPADVLARVELLRENVELIRRFMGKSQPPAALLRVETAQPREVYFQARNIHARASRLSFEQLRSALNDPSAPGGEIRPVDVFEVVDAALMSVLQVRRGLEIEGVVGERPKPESTTPSEVFNAIMLANSEINNLLQRQTSPSDVFRQVTAAVHYAGAIHTTISKVAFFPREPTFVPNKRPSDVYLRLQGCFTQIHEIAGAHGIPILTFNLPGEQARNVTPNDVSGLAALIVAELHYLHSQFPNSQPVAGAYHPGKKFPAHVFQRAGLLERILTDLVEAFRKAGKEETHPHQ